MCGVIFSIKSTEIDQTLYQKKLKLLTARGPDYQKSLTLNDKKVFLGHSRLSIMDLNERAHQPMSYKKRYYLIFNGEIYNYRSLRTKLERRGYQFKTNSDTEVLLKWLIEFKEKSIDKLNGMFSFILWDAKNREALIARDRFGIKPLYFTQQKGQFECSSQLNTFQPKINKYSEILFHLLGHIPEPFTIYEGVEAFPPGHYGTLRNNSIQLSPYHDFNQYTEQNHCEKDFGEKLKKVVSNFLVSDVKNGVLLSGGLHSSLIYALASQENNNFTSISVTFNSSDLSEKKYQDLMVQKYRQPYYEYHITQNEFKDNLCNFFKYMQQPSIDGYNTYLASKATAKNHCKVILSGLGADELFFSYPSFRRYKNLRRASYFPFKVIEHCLPGKFKKLSVLSHNNHFTAYLSQRMITSSKELYCHSHFKREDIISALNKYLLAIPSLDLINSENKISGWEVTQYMKNQLLRDSDVYSMAHSIELRVPFLDNELFKMIYSLPANKKMSQNGNEKKLLKKLAKLYIPEEIINRPKRGFELPYKDWICEHEKILDGCPEKMKNDFKQDKIHWSNVWPYIVMNNFSKNIKDIQGASLFKTAL